MNFSGRPNDGSCRAMRRHRSNPVPGSSTVLNCAGSSCDPKDELATQLPLVMNRRSFSERWKALGAPSHIVCTSVATLRSSVLENVTSTTSVFKWNCTPWPFK